MTKGLKMLVRPSEIDGMATISEIFRRISIGIIIFCSEIPVFFGFFLLILKIQRKRPYKILRNPEKMNSLIFYWLFGTDIPLTDFSSFKWHCEVNDPFQKPNPNPFSLSV
jgi:hypothetical protein